VREVGARLREFENEVARATTRSGAATRSREGAEATGDKREIESLK